MSNKIKLVQGDTKPQVAFSIKDSTTGDVVNLVGATVRLKFRELGSSTIKNTITCSLLSGKQMPDGSISNVAPYDVAGAGGRAILEWPEGALDTAGEFEGELEVTFYDGTVQTVYDRQRFTVREQF